MTRLLLLAFAALVAVPSALARCDIDAGGVLTQSAIRGNPGDIISFGYTFGNDGTTACPSVEVGYYLSDDAYLSNEDQLLGTGTIPASSPQQNVGGSGTITVPAGISRGGYSILVIADYLDTVPEDGQGNNIVLGKLTVGGDLSGPNLVLGLAALDETSAPPGGRISLDYSVGNQGQAGVGDVSVAFFLAEFNTPPSQWRLLERETIGNVEAGEVEEESEQLTIPPDVAPGEYGLVVWVDDLNVIEESIETDNTFGLGPVTVTGGTASQSMPRASALSIVASPNPAGASVRLSYTLAEAGPVRLVVSDALGREVAVVEGARDVGTQIEALDTATLAPGVYVVRLVAGAETAAVRLTVAR